MRLWYVPTNGVEAYEHLMLEDQYQHQVLFVMARTALSAVRAATHYQILVNAGYSTACFQEIYCDCPACGDSHWFIRRKPRKKGVHHGKN